MSASVMSHVATSLFYLSSIMKDRNIYSISTVGDMVSSLFYTLFYFYRRRIRNPLLFHSTSVLGTFGILGDFILLFFSTFLGTSCMYSFFISFRTDSDPYSSNTCNLIFTGYLVRAVCYRSSNTVCTMIYV